MFDRILAKPHFRLLLILLLVGCGSMVAEPIDSNTSWLRTCDTSADCDGEFACLCGLCTVECSSSGACPGGLARVFCGLPEDSCSEFSGLCLDGRLYSSASIETLASPADASVRDPSANSSIVPDAGARIEAGQSVPSPEECVVDWSTEGYAHECSTQCEGYDVSCSGGIIGTQLCSCVGGFDRIEVAGAPADGTACQLAVAACPATIDDLTCTPGSQDYLESDYCELDATCTKDYSSIPGVTVTAERYRFGVCSYEAGVWVCTCERNNGYGFRLEGDPVSEPLDACLIGGAVCDERDPPPYSEPTECVPIPRVTEARPDSCHIEANCYHSPVEWGGSTVAPWDVRTVDCRNGPNGWDCRCGSHEEYLPGERDGWLPEVDPCVDYFLSNCGGVL